MISSTETIIIIAESSLFKMPFNSVYQMSALSLLIESKVVVYFVGLIS